MDDGTKSKCEWWMGHVLRAWSGLRSIGCKAYDIRSGRRTVQEIQ